MSTGKSNKPKADSPINEPPSSDSRIHLGNGPISESERQILHVVQRVGPEVVLALSSLATEAGNQQRWGDMKRYLSCANDLSSAYSDAYAQQGVAQAAGGSR